MSADNGINPLDLNSRKILGFDVRAGLSAIARSSIVDSYQDPKNSRLKRVLCRLTLDLQLWPSVLGQAGSLPTHQLNGYNLHYELTDDLIREAGKQGEATVRVAFDVSMSTYQSLERTFGAGWNKQNATSQELLDTNWALLVLKSSIPECS
ncbi:MAG: hypothetical protein WKH97_08210 [Casimicrobiaceae bacterium]